LSQGDIRLVLSTKIVAHLTSPERSQRPDIVYNRRDNNV